MFRTSEQEKCHVKIYPYAFFSPSILCVAQNGVFLKKGLTDNIGICIIMYIVLKGHFR